MLSINKHPIENKKHVIMDKKLEFWQRKENSMLIQISSIIKNCTDKFRQQD